MKYTVMPKSPDSDDVFSVNAPNEREALNIATRLLEHGCAVEIFSNSDGRSFGIAELERTLIESAAT